MEDPIRQIKELAKGLTEDDMPLEIFDEKLYKIECGMCTDFLRSSARDIDRRAVVLRPSFPKKDIKRKRK